MIQEVVPLQTKRIDYENSTLKSIFTLFFILAVSYLSISI